MPDPTPTPDTALPQTMEQGAPSGPPIALPPTLGGGPQDPRWAALAALQHSGQPQGAAPQGGLSKILQAIGPLAAAIATGKQGTGLGSFMKGYEDQQKFGLQRQAQQQQLAEHQSLTALHQAQLLHEMAQEQHEQRQEQLRQQTIAAAEKKSAEQAASQAREKEYQKIKDTYTRNVGTLQDIFSGKIDLQGQDPEKYLKASSAPAEIQGAKNPLDGSPITSMYDLARVFSSVGPDGKLDLSKQKSDKEAKAGTPEFIFDGLVKQYTSKFGRPPNDAEKASLNRAAMQEHAKFSANPDLVEMNMSLKSLQKQLDTAKLTEENYRIEALKQANAPIKPGSKYWNYAQGLASGALSIGELQRQIPYDRTMPGRVDTLANIYNTALQINPNFNVELFNAGKRFITSTQTQRQLAAQANVASVIPSLVQWSNQATRSNLKVLNEKVIIPGGIQIGDQNYSNFGAALDAFGDELGLALGTGQGSDFKIKFARGMADGTLSPDAFAAELQGPIYGLLNQRRKSLLRQGGPLGQMMDQTNQMPPVGRGSVSSGNVWQDSTQ